MLLTTFWNNLVYCSLKHGTNLKKYYGSEQLEGALKKISECEKVAAVSREFGIPVVHCTNKQKGEKNGETFLRPSTQPKLGEYMKADFDDLIKGMQQQIFFADSYTIILKGNEIHQMMHDKLH